MQKFLWVFFALAALGIGAYLGLQTGDSPKVDSSPQFQMIFLEPELGGGVLVITPEKRTLLIDPGSNETAENLKIYLQNTNISPNAVLLTTTNSKRIGAFAEINNSFKLNRLLIGEAFSFPSAPLINTADNLGKKLPENLIMGGDKIFISKSTSIDVLSPYRGTSNDPKDNIIILRIVYGNYSFLMISDSGIKQQSELIMLNKSIESDVLIVPADNSNSPTLEMLVKIRPDNIIVNPVLDVVSSSALRRMGTSHTQAQLYRTDEIGTIILTCNGKTINIKKEQINQ